MLLWLANMGNAGGVGIVAPTIPGMEWTLPDSRLHYTLPDNVLDYELPENRLNFTLRDEND